MGRHEVGGSEPGSDVTASSWPSPPTRRRFLASAGASALAIAGLRVGTQRAQRSSGAEPAVTARQLLTRTLTVDMHSHAGRFVRDNTAFEPVAEPMRAGGLAVACLAILADSPTHRAFPDRRIHPFRAPEPGELYAWSRTAFGQLLRLAQEQQLHVVGDVAQLRAAPATGPSIIMTAEGADFLKGRIERVDEMRISCGMRHLQLVHYRPNELGDIQTEDPVQGGLKDSALRSCVRAIG